MSGRLSEADLYGAFERAGALVRNSHLIYTSGRHGSDYVNKDALYPHTDVTSRLCREIAHRFLADKIEVVLAPALGGIILSQWTAHHLSELGGKSVLAVYAEKDATGENFLLKRGYDALVAGKRTLILEDILTTGISVRKVVEVARASRADVVGVGALVNRGGVTAEQLGGVPKLDTLLAFDLPSWDPSECPLCKEGRPINRSLGKAKTQG